MRDTFFGIAAVFVLTGLALVGLYVAQEIHSRFAFGGSGTIAIIGPGLLTIGLLTSLAALILGPSAGSYRRRN